MNFDQRSRHLNTESGLIIDSPELARQTAIRFEAMVRPANTYVPALTKGSSRLLWHTEETGLAVEYPQKPPRSSWQRVQLGLLSLLPIDREL